LHKTLKSDESVNNSLSVLSVSSVVNFAEFGLNWQCQVNRKANVCLMTERDTSLQMSHFAQAIGQKMKFMIDQKRLP
jgi:hypothetical protein